MTPVLAKDNMVHGGKRNMERLSNGGLRFAFRDTTAYLKDLLFRETGLGVRFARRPGVVATSFLGNLVSVVVSYRAKEQVARIHAASVVAGVTNAQVGRNGTIVKCITEAVSSINRHTTKFCQEASITAACRACLPFPTIVRSASIYSFPKSFRQGAVGSNLVEMSSDKTIRFAFHIAFLGVTFGSNSGLFATTTMAITVRDFLRGIMEVHGKRLLSVSNPGTFRDVARCFYWGATPVSIAQKGV